MRVKPMQSLNSYMVDEIEKIVKLELKHNKEAVQVFMNIPREEDIQLDTSVKQPKHHIKKAQREYDKDERQGVNSVEAIVKFQTQEQLKKKLLEEKIKKDEEEVR